MSSIADIITRFGSLNVLVVPTGLILLWLYWRGFLRAAAVFALTFASAAALTYAIKWALFTPQDLFWDKKLAVFSQYFPSGHVVFASIVFGALGIIAREVGRAPAAIAYGVPVAIVLLIGWSRTAIQAHPWGDVAGGCLLGGAAVLLFRHFAGLGNGSAGKTADLMIACGAALALFAVLPLPLDFRVR